MLNIKTELTDFWEAHRYTYEAPVWFEGGGMETHQACDEYLKEIGRGIMAELCGELGEDTYLNGADHTFYVFSVPFTILDPSTVPPCPNFWDEDTGRAYAAQLEPWGGSKVEGVAMFLNLLEPDTHAPFTIYGVWSDGEVGGLFGVTKGKPAIRVLFC